MPCMQSYKLEAVHMVDMLRSKREFLREHHLIPLRCSGWSCRKPCCKCEKPMKDTCSECTHPKAGPMICQGTNSLQLSGTTSACSQVLPLMNLNLGRIIFRKWIFTFLTDWNLTQLLMPTFRKFQRDFLRFHPTIHSYCWRKATLFCPPKVSPIRNVCKMIALLSGIGIVVHRFYDVPWSSILVWVNWTPSKSLVRWQKFHPYQHHSWPRAKQRTWRMPHAYHVHTRKYISITLQYVQAFGKMWILNFSTATWTPHVSKIFKAYVTCLNKLNREEFHDSTGLTWT